MVFDLLRNPKTASLMSQVLVSLPDYEARSDYRQYLQEAMDQRSDGNSLLIQLVAPDVFLSCSDTMTPQGIVAVVDIPNYDNNNNNNRLDHPPPLPPFHLVLDGVSDPGNLGTLLRSSLAVGVALVVLLPGCCDVWNPKAVRSAMGASFVLPAICHCDSWDDGLAALRDVGVQTIYAATMMDGDDELETKQYDKHNKSTPTTALAHSASIPYFDVDWTKESSALIIGSEGNGLSAEVRAALLMKKKVEVEDPEGDSCVVRATHLPMQEGIESLNAAVCGSVILFEYSRQCSAVNAAAAAASSSRDR